MKYELIMLLKPEKNEEEVDQIIEKYQKLIEASKGIFVGAEKWGKRAVAVKFRKKNISEAYYLLLNFTNENQKLDKIEYKLKIDENVIRHMIVNTSKAKKKIKIKSGKAA